MRHRKSNVKLGRTASHRRMLLRNLVTSLYDGYLVDEAAERAKADKAAADGREEEGAKARRPARRKVNRLVTTVDKAKAMKPLVDKVAVLAKKGDVQSRLRAMAILTKSSTVARLFEEVGKGALFADRQCGFMSMGRVGVRKGDAAVMAACSLIVPGYVKAGSGGGRGTRTADRARRVAASRRRQAELESGKEG